MARVLITGCSTGIGRATAVELTQRGYEVIATARRPESLADLEVAMKLRLDVDDAASVEDAVDAAGPLDVLVNNAAWGVAGPVEKVPIERVTSMFETNVFGILRMIQAVAPVLRERGGGTIVNVSSVAGRVVTPLNGTYAASKHAVEAISEALAYELGHFGIRVAIVEPGTIATSWSDNEQWWGVDSPPYDELYRQMTAGDERLAGGEALPGPELVAATVAEAIESSEPRLRWPVGRNAPQILAARAQLDDERWEKITRSTMGIDW